MKLYSLKGENITSATTLIIVIKRQDLKIIPGLQIYSTNSINHNTENKMTFCGCHW